MLPRDRLIGAILLETSEEWQTERSAYFNMESVRLPATPSGGGKRKKKH